MQWLGFTDEFPFHIVMQHITVHIYLARSAKLLTGLYILLALISSFPLEVGHLEVGTPWLWVGVWGALKFPQRVQAEPGNQTYFGAI